MAFECNYCNSSYIHKSNECILSPLVNYCEKCKIYHGIDGECFKFYVDNDFVESIKVD
jgi:hypothetical protein